MAEPHALRVNRPNVVDETLDGEALIVNLGSGVYYSIAGTGEVIWRMLSQGVPLIAVAENLQQRFDVTAEDASAAVGAFAGQLLAEELLVPADADVADVNSGSGTSSAGGTRAPWAVPELKRYADMQDLLLLDPVHDVNEQGWPNANAAPLAGTERRG